MSKRLDSDVAATKDLRVDLVEESRYSVNASEVISAWTLDEQDAFWRGDDEALEAFEESASWNFAGKRGDIDLTSNVRERLAAQTKDTP